MQSLSGCRCPRPLIRRLGANVRTGWILRVAVVLLLGVVLSYATYEFGASRRDLPAPVNSLEQDNLFEAQGALTFGCALWLPIKIDAYDELTKDARPLEDFYLSANSSQGLLVVARDDGIIIASGLRCGISVDWRRFPREGN